MKQGSLDLSVVGVKGFQPASNQGPLGILAGRASVMEGGNFVPARIASDYVLVNKIKRPDQEKHTIEKWLHRDHRADLSAEATVDAHGVLERELALELRPLIDERGQVSKAAAGGAAALARRRARLCRLVLPSESHSSLPPRTGRLPRRSH